MHCADVPCAGLGSLKDPLRMNKRVCVWGLCGTCVDKVLSAYSIGGVVYWFQLWWDAL